MDYAACVYSLIASSGFYRNGIPLLRNLRLLGDFSHILLVVLREMLLILRVALLEVEVLLGILLD